MFVEKDSLTDVKQAVNRKLPEEFRGWPTVFGWDETEPRHHVEVATIGAWLQTRLGLDPRTGMSSVDWLTAPQQLLLEVTAGEVFHDGLGELRPIRETLRWYPDDVWRYLLASQWVRIAQEEAFVGRTAEVGDQLGSRVIAARLVRDVMRLCFLLERRYAPYSKWLGSAFARLDIAVLIAPALQAAVDAADYPTREDALVTVYEHAARHRNDLRIAPQIDPAPRLFHSRPYRVLDAGRLASACQSRIVDPWLRRLPLVGGVDQFVDSSDVLSHSLRPRRLAPVYEE